MKSTPEKVRRKRLVGSTPFTERTLHRERGVRIMSCDISEYCTITKIDKGQIQGVSTFVWLSVVTQSRRHCRGLSINDLVTHLECFLGHCNYK